MKVEWYALAVAALGVGLWIWGSVLDSVLAMLFFTLFSGGAAFIIGHATIQPVAFSLVFVFAHLLLSMFKRTDHANLGFKSNGFLAFFCLYAAAGAFLLPKLFTKAMTVAPLSGTGLKSQFMATPLHFSPQNITTAIYLIGTLITSICAGAAAVDPKSRRAVVWWAIAISWIHMAFGLAGLLLPSEFIALFRNATYAELEQTEGGFVRISGIMPEPSAYAAYAFGWFVFMAELWLRDVSPRLTMITAAALGLMLLACTSTAGYVALALYAILLLARFFVSPASFRLNKAVPVGMAVLAGLTLILGVFAFVPHVAESAGRALKQITVGKADSLSGRQRLYDVSVGLKAFQETWGLGIGAGSFRSSSIIVAILGGTGIIGFLAFTGHFLKILKPLRLSTHALPGNPGQAVPVAAAWAACAGLIPAMLAGPTPDPSFVFAIMGGLALGWREGVRPRTIAVSMAGRRSGPTATIVASQV